MKAATPRAFHVVYLTGAPASGKSTLLQALADQLRPMVPFSYSKELADHIARKRGEVLSEDGIRAASSRSVTTTDVKEVDEGLIELVNRRRGDAHVVIDSHAVTKESYGFRVTPFSASTLRALAPTMIVVLYTAPDVAIARIKANAAGRPVPTLYESALHNDLQATVALIYGIAAGLPVYFLDATASAETLVQAVVERML